MKRLSFLVGCALAGCTVDAPESISTSRDPIVVCTKGETVEGIEGIDVSEWQEGIDWSAVRKSGRAIARVSYGSAHIDATFPGNSKGMRDAGLIRGAYQWHPLAKPGVFGESFVRPLRTWRTMLRNKADSRSVASRGSSSCSPFRSRGASRAAGIASRTSQRAGRARRPIFDCSARTWVSP